MIVLLVYLILEQIRNPNLHFEGIQLNLLYDFYLPRFSGNCSLNCSNISNTNQTFELYWTFKYFNTKRFYPTPFPILKQLQLKLPQNSLLSNHGRKPQAFDPLNGSILVTTLFVFVRGHASICAYRAKSDHARVHMRSRTYTGTHTRERLKRTAASGELCGYFNNVATSL